MFMDRVFYDRAPEALKSEMLCQRRILPRILPRQQAYNLDFAMNTSLAYTLP
jgi:hypothetical protein